MNAVRSILLATAVATSLTALTPTSGRSTAPVSTNEIPPLPLSSESKRVDIRSSAGSGVFGRWAVDRFGLPAYDYTIDQTTDPRAERAELEGRRDAWHQVGNDAIVANASADGHVQLWSQQRRYQWSNRWDPANRHFTGGFGWLRDAGRVSSTLWLDRPPGSRTQRRFGVGYVQRRLATRGVQVNETVTAPWGRDPVLVHEVTLRNRTDQSRPVTWWEYWDVNPYDQTQRRQQGLAAPEWDPDRRLLTADQAPDAGDTDPLTIFLAADAPVAGFETDNDVLFGAGTRGAPAAVTTDRATGSIAPPTPPGSVGRTGFALRSPVTLPAKGAVTLRYVYGIAHDEDIPEAVQRATSPASTVRDTARAWRNWVPKVDLGHDRRWLSRELQWDAYAVRSATNYEETCGHQVITQGGYYQYGGGHQIAFRDPLQHMLPMVYAAPEIAREVLRYSFQQQTPETGVMPYGMVAPCQRLDIGASNDLDFWLLLSTVEYVLGTRDLAFLDEPIPYDGGLPGPAPLDGTVWEHVKLAVHHQENLVGRGPNGQYLIQPTGDWSDLSSLTLGMTESTMVTAQLAYVYPRLAEVADLRGDTEFANLLRAKGRELVGVLHKEWTGRGWWSRGYSGTTQLGKGAIFAEPQPWALLAGADTQGQAATVVANIQRFLQGRGAPPELGGPTKIGTSQSPAEDDPEVTEKAQVYAQGVGDGNAVWVGGVWYALNGPLTWALGELDGRVPGAARKALDELERNTLTAHARAYPESWDGVTNVDDACWSFYSSEPDRCGLAGLIELFGTAGQITHQPAWNMFSLLKLAGLTPTAAGYRITPHLPLDDWSIRFPGVGLAQQPGELRGYLRPEGSGRVTLEVTPRGATETDVWSAWVDGDRVASRPGPGGSLRFTLTAHAGKVVDWAVTKR